MDPEQQMENRGRKMNKCLCNTFKPQIAHSQTVATQQRQRMGWRSGSRRSINRCINTVNRCADLERVIWANLRRDRQLWLVFSTPGRWSYSQHPPSLFWKSSVTFHNQKRQRCLRCQRSSLGFRFGGWHYNKAVQLSKKSLLPLHACSLTSVYSDNVIALSVYSSKCLNTNPWSNVEKCPHLTREKNWNNTIVPEIRFMPWYIDT